MKYFITGGCGFLGSNLAARLLSEDHKVSVYDNFSRSGCEPNLEWLRTVGPVQALRGDVRNATDLSAAIRSVSPDAIFHLAGQVAMTTSLGDPRSDFETNATGSINLLEAVRKNVPEATVIYSSTNKVYGDLRHLDLVEDASRYREAISSKGIDETMPLSFLSPYGCSKGAADQYMLEYARAYGLKTVVFRHSSIYGGRQFATTDQGWVGWFCRQALETRATPGRPPFTIAGNGKQVRDVLHVADAVEVYLAAVREIAVARGEAFNIGGGLQNSLSLLELFTYLSAELNVRLNYRMLPEREADQKFFVADSTKAERILGWVPTVSNDVGIGTVVAWEVACATA